MSEQAKMLAGQLYDPTDPELDRQQRAAHVLNQAYNQSAEQPASVRAALIDELVPHHGVDPYFQGPIFFDYGRYTTIGDDFYGNTNFTVLDSCPVTIGNNVMCGPNVTLVTPMHPLRYQDRNLRTRPDGSKYDLEYAKPITIGNNCWLASNVTVIGGVTIGDGCVIGAGSVVTHDIPANSLAVGNPCRVLRPITADDALDMSRETPI
ncbi:acetyltransferase [Levilactobacillus zymae]|uniref:Acetyltransferase n=1 Tax=Levilactobacillus zymae TaxID=267363 RepID=A0ABQ0WUV7_9LACO|nr:sugar O-acetyltransferase [Levilactobacillus zymae]KRL15196.1 galactoside O-acetyltransferase [Levilactobacillus zymae DSM 19395]QFR61485.1 sugar O-acetyltransferase [Levilactobacillus zymae]GEO71635.1 acetyltransferase [Levilactobacillus zymae]